MGSQTGIAWCDHTFNPWMGCEKVSEGCAFCYAETLVTGRMGLDVWGPGKTRQVTSQGYWKQPQRWDRNAYPDFGRQARVFCGSLCDVFEDHEIAATVRPRLFSVIRSTLNLNWLLLTKRPERIRECLPPDWGPGYDNVWLGTSIESNRVVERADILRELPAVVRFVSYEPAIGPIAEDLNLEEIHWLICGGESGKNHRRMKLDWARDAWAACADAGTAFFFKQISAFKPGQGADALDGRLIQEFPADRAWR